jgi:Domain of unknown function (DUF4438)
MDRRLDLRRHSGSLTYNRDELVVQTVMGQIAHPIGRASPYRIGQDGVPRVLPGTGGISINQRIGDRCVGLAADHVEPGVALHNNGREIVGPRNGPNTALLTLACVGNGARVISGPCTGETGLVTGKHGGVNHVMVDFPTGVLRRLCIGDRIQINAWGAGLRLLDFPEITVSNLAPSLLRRWGLRSRGGTIEVPVTHCVPAFIVGSGLGKNTVWRGDFDLQLFDPTVRDRFHLGSLRFGDLVAVIHSDARFGPSYRGARITLGVIVHSDSTVSGHGPGVTALLTGPAVLLRPVRVPTANLAVLFDRRRIRPATEYAPLAGRPSRVRARVNSREYAFQTPRQFATIR